MMMMVIRRCREKSIGDMKRTNRHKISLRTLCEVGDGGGLEMVFFLSTSVLLRSKDMAAFMKRKLFFFFLLLVFFFASLYANKLTGESGDDDILSISYLENR